MKICLVSSFQKISGAGRQAFLLAGSLREAGHQVFLVSLEEESEAPLPCQEHSLSSQSLIKYEKVAPVSLKDFLYNKRGFYDLVHFFGDRVEPSLIGMLRRLDKPVIIRPTGFRLDLPEGVLKADACIGISEPLYQNLRKSGKTVVKIANAVDTGRYAPLTGKEERNRLKKRLGFSGRDRIVLFVGAFHREKGAALMISGWPIVRAAFPEAVLVVAGPLCTICRKKCESVEEGDEPFTDRFKRLAGLLTDKFSSLLEKEEGIRFLGSVAEVLPYLQVAELFWFPSRQEGMPNALLEAMSCGLACVTSSIPEITSEMIVDCSLGVAVKGREPEKYARAIIKLLSHEKRQQNLGKNARQRVIGNFSLKSNLEAHVKLYRQLLAN